jgi:RND family efflux transporter MFP subunit
MRFKTAIILFSFLCLLFTFNTPVIAGKTAAAQETAAAEEKKPEKCPGRVKVLVEPVVPGTFLEYKDLQKRILPARDTEIKNTLAGIIKKVEKPVGSEIKTGDVILTLDTAKLEKEIADAKAEIKRWKRILWRREHWKERSQSSENQAKRRIKRDEEALAKAEAQLPQCTVTSPVDGMLAALKANEGDHISEGYVIANVVDVQKVKITLTRYVDNVTNGQKIKILLKELSKTVEGIVQKDDAGRGTFIFIDNQNRKILIGMTAAFRVLLKEHKDVVALPEEKLLRDDGGAFVYTVDPATKRARKSYLKPGPAEKGIVLIREGLAGGDEIIVSEVLSAKQGSLKEGLPCIQDNKKIKVVVLDSLKGKFVKRKPGKKEIVEAKVEKPPMVKPVKKRPPEVEVPIPVKKKPVEKKPAPPVKVEIVPKKEVKPEVRPVDAFIAYLKKNKETLNYRRYRKVVNPDSVQVRIECDSAAKDRLLKVVEEFKTFRYCVVIISTEERYVNVFFQREKIVPLVLAEPRTFMDKLRIGATLSYYRMFNNIFDEIYGRMVGFNVDISYMVSDKIDVWFSAGLSSKKAEIDWAEEPLEFKFKAFSLDVRYFFKKSEKWDIFAGAGFNLYPFEEINPIENVKDNAFGFNGLVGAYYNITKKFSLQLILRINLVTKALENVDNDLNMNSAELMFGLSYNL